MSRKWKSSDIVYGITVKDVQTVAKEKFGRKMTNAEITLVRNYLGNGLDWNYEDVEQSILDCVHLGLIKNLPTPGDGTF